MNVTIVAQDIPWSHTASHFCSGSAGRGRMSAPPLRRKRSHPDTTACSASSMALLPLDLLTLIFDLLPRPGRLSVCGLVCKWWRTAAVHHINSFSLEYPRDSRRPLAALRAAYPHITQLSLRLVNAMEELAFLPSTLRRLEFSYSVEGEPRLPPRLPDTIIDLSLPVRVALHPFVPWLHQLHASLTRLSLPLAKTLSAEERDFFGDAHLSCLTQLELDIPGDTPHGDLLVGFLRRHSSRLTGLRLVGRLLTTTEAFPPPPVSLCFPGLRELHVTGFHPNTTRLLLEACPNLSRLSLLHRDASVVLQTPQALATLVSFPQQPITVGWHLLARCTRLERLDRFLLPLSFDMLTEPTIQEVLGRLVELHADIAHASTLPDMGFPCLRTLSIRFVPLLKTMPERPWRLPCLTHLTVVMPDFMLSARIDAIAPLLTHVRYLVECAPQLRHLDVDVRMDILSAAGVDDVIFLLSELEARGVEEVILHKVASPRLKAAARAYTWMRVTLTQEIPDCEAPRAEDKPQSGKQPLPRLRWL